MDGRSLTTPTGSGPAAAVLLIALLGYLVFLEVVSYVIAQRHSVHGHPA